MCRTLLLFSFLISFVICDPCEPGWTYYDGSQGGNDNSTCLKMFPARHEMDDFNRNFLCVNQSAQPVVVRSYLENAFIMQYLFNDPSYDKLFVGFYCAGGNKLRTFDGSRISYIPSDPQGKPIVCPNTDIYFFAMLSNGAFDWFKTPSTDGILCEKPVRTNCPSPFKRGDAKYGTEQNCYLVQSNANWTNAQKNCAKYGAQLATVLTEDENKYVTSLVEAHESNPVNQQAWLGGVAIQETWFGMDGKPLTTYDNTSKKAKITGCLALAADRDDKSNYEQGEWFGEDCTVTERVYVCKMSTI